MAENFFSILKTECIYRHKPATFPEANEMIDRYIHFFITMSASVKDWRGAACATPLLLKLDISYQGSFLYCLHNLGQFTQGERGAFLKTGAEHIRPGFIRV